MDSHLIIHVATDTIDSFILLLAQIATILAAFSTAVSIFFLIDYFKRHSWQYHKKKTPVERTTADIPYEKKVVEKTQKEKKEKRIKKTSGAPF